MGVKMPHDSEKHSVKRRLAGSNNCTFMHLKRSRLGKKMNGEMYPNEKQAIIDHLLEFHAMVAGWSRYCKADTT